MSENFHQPSPFESHPSVETAQQIERMASKIGSFGLQDVEMSHGLIRDRDIVGVQPHRVNEKLQDEPMLTKDVVPARFGSSIEEDHTEIKLRPINATSNGLKKAEGISTDASGETRLLSDQETRDAAADILFKAYQRKKSSSRTQEAKHSARQSKELRRASIAEQKAKDTIKVAAGVIGGPGGYIAASKAIEKK